MTLNLKVYLRAKLCDELFFNIEEPMDAHEIMAFLHPLDSQYFVKEILKCGSYQNTIL